MTTKAKANKCVTHHFACDCREYRYEQMESALKVIRAWTSYELETGTLAASCEDIKNLAEKALKNDL